MPDIMIARRTGIVRMGGQRRTVHKGRTTAHATHPIVTAHPKLWEPIRVDWPAEAPEPARSSGAEPKPADVRRWAREHDIEVPARGKLAPELVERYKAAQRDGEG